MGTGTVVGLLICGRILVMVGLGGLRPVVVTVFVVTCLGGLRPVMAVVFVMSGLGGLTAVVTAL
ncbi:MAG: hypothetical protein ABEI99_09425, partial [Halobaculum sp.]